MQSQIWRTPSLKTPHINGAYNKTTGVTAGETAFFLEDTMPIFDYHCNGLDCQNKEELLVNSSEKPNCSKCGRILEKQVSAPKGYVRGSNNPVKQ